MNEGDLYTIHFNERGVLWVQGPDGTTARHPELTADERFKPYRVTLLDRLRGAFYGAVAGWRGD